MVRRSLLSLCLVVAVGCGTQQEAGQNRSGASLEAGPSVTPVLIPNDNPTCADLGYAFELKIDNVNGAFSGTFTSSDGYLTVNGTSVDGTYFSFTSNVGVDVVLMKGGHAANAYSYSPETLGDSNLVSPDNASGGPAAISHVTFCYDFEVGVTKTAATSFKRDHAWSIEKSSPTTELLLSDGQIYTAGYTVTVGTTGYADSDYAVAGTITITNPAPMEATIEGVADAMGAITAPVDCGQAFPFTLAAGASVTCTYGAALPDASSLTNVATVTTSGAVGGNSGEAAVDFGSATITEIDACVTVTDDRQGALGTACAFESPKTFTYQLDVGPYSTTVVTCDVAFNFDNTASYVAESGETGSDTHSIAVTVACPVSGCSLTQGYWKTHSEYGPAPYDETWELLANGADTAFFSTGMSWYSLFWTAPQGNAYIQLAHQYMAAYLNGLNGANTSAITAQLAAAQALLSTYTQYTLPRSKFSEARSRAGTLDAYNNGLIGPGHCSE